ncbi:MAG: hypothetical protein ACOH2F_07095 [Cellulomonas sp.]
MSRSRFVRLPHLAVPVAAVAALLLLAGCSGDASGSSPETSAASPSPSGAASGQRPGGMPDGGGGVTGTIAAVTGAILQVQSTDTQTAVTYTDATVITQTVAATLEQVTVGSCITATSDAATDDSSAATTTATTVRITAAVDGACATGFGRGGMPSDGQLPGGFGQRVGGLVTAVTGTTITVEVTGQDSATSTETVEVTAADAATPTTYTSAVAADATAIVVGQCATALGANDDSGQLTATSLTLSVAGADGCTQAAGMPGGMGRGPARNAASND